MLSKVIFICLVVAAVCQNGLRYNESIGQISANTLLGSFTSLRIEKNKDLESIIRQVLGTLPPTDSSPFRIDSSKDLTYSQPNFDSRSVPFAPTIYIQNSVILNVNDGDKEYRSRIETFPIERQLESLFRQVLITHPPSTSTPPSLENHKDLESIIRQVLMTLPPSVSTPSPVENNKDLESIIRQVLMTLPPSASTPPLVENNKNLETIIRQVLMTLPPSVSTPSPVENNKDLESIIRQVLMTLPPPVSTPSPVENNKDLESIIRQVLMTLPPSASSHPPVENNKNLETIIRQVLMTLPPSVSTPSPVENNKHVESSTRKTLDTTPSVSSTSSSVENNRDRESSTQRISGTSPAVSSTSSSVENNRDQESSTQRISGTSPAVSSTSSSVENNRDQESSTQRISGTSPAVSSTLPTEENKNKVPRPSTSPPSPDMDTSTSDETNNVSCTLSNGQRGECVIYYLCNVNNTDDFIERSPSNRSCPSYVDTCCRVSEETETPVTLSPDSEPAVERKGCGWRNTMGVGFGLPGYFEDETAFGEFPWMCAVLSKIKLPDNDEPDGQRDAYKYIGGGSLIHPSVVLTAAYDVASVAVLRVRAGEWDTATLKEPFPHQDRDVVSFEIHPDFNKGTLFYDIAILFLSQPVGLEAPNVGVVCLPPPRLRVPGGTRCVSAGWGKDKFGRDGLYQVLLKKIEVPVVERTACQSALRMTRLGRFFELHSSFMCAGGEPGKDTCQGDGGSPLSCPIESQDGRYMQSGIVSWGIGCGQDGIPGVYIDVASLRGWIDAKVIEYSFDPEIYSFKE